MKQLEFLPNRFIDSMNIVCEDGSYGLDVVPFAFEKCRERFALKFKENTKGFYFKHSGHEGTLPGEKGKNIAIFINKTEEILEQKEFTRFALTNRPTIIWVEPSMFWKSCKMRRSLFTILLRAGVLYDSSEDNYQHALFGEQYTIPTVRAVMRFMFGYTKYVGPILESNPGATYEQKGWKKIFEAQDDLTIKKYLVRPDNHKMAIPELKKALWVI